MLLVVEQFLNGLQFGLLLFLLAVLAIRQARDKGLYQG